MTNLKYTCEDCESSFINGFTRKISCDAGYPDSSTKEIACSDDGWFVQSEESEIKHLREELVKYVGDMKKIQNMFVGKDVILRMERS